MSALLLHPTRPRLPRRFLWIPWAGGAVLILVWAWATGWPRTTLKPDIEQGRLNVALPAPTGAAAIRQTFTPRRDGWQELELVLVRYGEPEGEDSGRLFLYLLDAAGDLVAQTEWATANIRHNDNRRFRFAPQPGGQPYTLLIQGNETNQVSVWAYDLDLLAGGELQLVGLASQAQELRFTTYYRLTLGQAVVLLGQMVGQQGLFFLLTLLLLLLPGLLLIRAWDFFSCWRPRQQVGRLWPHDWPTHLALAMAISLTFWAWLWLWWSWLGLRWSSWSLWLLVTGLLAAGGWLAAVSRSPHNFADSPTRPLAYSPTRLLAYLPLFLTLLLGFAGRLLALRDVAFPPWVDSSRHALITAVMMDRGQFLPDYAPFLPVERAPYHYGFHALTATLGLMTGREVHELLLWLGPLLNGLAPLAVYAAAFLFTRHRSVSSAAAFLVALPFFFPAYYATWGRFTQLTGMLILPLLLGLTWQLGEGCGRRAANRWQMAKMVMGIGGLAAGLFLLHFRVFLLYIPFALLVLFWHTGRILFFTTPLIQMRSRLGQLWGMLAAAAGLALILIIPRLVRLGQEHTVSSVLASSPEGYNDFPVAYFKTGWETPFAYAALAGVVAAFLVWLGGRRWGRVPLLLGLWVGALFLLLGGRALGLPETWLINMNSMVISLYLPTALVLAMVIIPLGQWLTRSHWLLQVIGYGVIGGWFAAAALFGLERQSSILNEQTILARPADVAGLSWVRENIPAEALTATSSWRWLGQTWAGSDGGAWLVPLTGIQATAPPVDYLYNRQLSLQVQSWNVTMSEITDWASEDAAAYLRSQGITHIFVGQKGGFFDPSALSKNNVLTLLYQQDGVFVFAVRD